MKGTEITEVKVDALFEKIAGLIEESRKKVSSAINIAEVYTKYNVGRYIIEHEQEGKYKATYGKQVLVHLSKKLRDTFGSGWSQDILEKCRWNIINDSILKEWGELLSDDIIKEITATES